MIRRTLIAAASVAALLGGGTAVMATAGTASAATISSQVTSVTNRDDSGYSAQIPSLDGNWATDTYTRTSSVTFVEQTSGSACEGSDDVTISPCYEFTGSIADSGTFLMDAGAVSPNTGATVVGDPTGTMTGGDSGFTFYADAMPSTTPAPTVSGDVPSTGNWLKDFFAKGTDFIDPGGTEGANAYLLGNDWYWKYNDLKSCEQWVDAAAVSQADSGDITGNDNCTTSVTSPGNQSGTVGTPVSLQVAGSTTSSDTALTYAATGLPAGLSIDASTGLITGTPTAAESTDVVTVKVTDWGNLAAWTHFGFTVSPATSPPPQPSTKLTARYVCGRSASHVVWLVSNTQGAGPAIANFTARVRSRWVFDGSASIALHGSHRLTTAGTTLNVYYDANGSRPAPKEAGALSVTATAPLGKRCG